jgi:uncharacterized membrane protein
MIAVVTIEQGLEKLKVSVAIIVTIVTEMAGYVLIQEEALGVGLDDCVFEV